MSAPPLGRAEGARHRRITPPATGSSPLRAGPALPPAEFARVRRACVLEHCKWDPQVGDAETLAPFPVLITRQAWSELERETLALAGETLAAETELARCPRLHKRLGLPPALGRVLALAADLGETPSLARTMRFDFHWTTDRWRISEVNSDVPGGFGEAEGFTALMAARFPSTKATGAPASRWAEAVAASVAPGVRVALLRAPGFMEDHQVVAYLASRLRALGLVPLGATPSSLSFRAGRAECRGELGAVVRFYQAEWLARLPAAQWEGLFAGGVVPVTNAGRSALSESKRMPLLFGALRASTAAFRRLLPETRDPRDAPFLRDDGWLLKAAYSNTGDAVVARPWVSGSRFGVAVASALLNPGAWVAQRRFETLSIETPLGPLYPCIGVYTIDGEVAGAYARLSAGPVVDASAIDAALLLSEREALADAREDGGAAEPDIESLPLRGDAEARRLAAEARRRATARGAGADVRTAGGEGAR